MSDLQPPDDLPPPAPLPGVDDSPLGILADASTAPPRPAKPVAKKVVKKVVKKVAKKAVARDPGAGGSSTVKPIPPPGGTTPARPTQAKAGAPSAQMPASARITGRTPAVPASAAPPSGKAPRPKVARARNADSLDALLDDRPAPPPTRTLGADAQASVKGLFIIGLALAAGFVLLSLGYSRENTLVAGRQTPVSESTTTTASPFYGTTTSMAPITTTPVALKSVSELTVQVANAGNLPGTPAGDATAKMSAAGYQTRSAIDAPLAQSTTVYYADDLKAEAEEAAKVLKIAPDKVAPMPSPLPTYAQGVQLLIELGPEYSPSTLG